MMVPGVLFASAASGRALMAYSYALDNPLLYDDFTGLCPCGADYPNGRSWWACFQDEVHRQVGNVIGPLCLAIMMTCSVEQQMGNPQAQYCAAAAVATCGPTGAAAGGRAAGWCSTDAGRCFRSPI